MSTRIGGASPDTGALAGSPRGAPRLVGDDPAEAARQLESYFLRQVFSAMREGSGGGSLLDGGFAGSTFHEMLDEAMAEQVAKSGTLGLAKTLEPLIAEQGARKLGAALGAAGGGGPPPDAGSAGSAGSIGPAGPRSAPALLPLRAGGVATRPLSAYRHGGGAPAIPALAAPLDAVQPSSPFGARIDPIEGDRRFHAGLDLRASEGTPVKSAGAGVVRSAGAAGGYGQLVVVDHGNGVETRYGHLSRIDVRPGQELQPGQPIGAVGQTGRATGPHLHFEVRQDGHATNPASAAGILATTPGAEKK